MKKCKILIADDHVILREGLKALLKMESEFEVVGEASNGIEALQLAGKTNPDVILLDLSMPHANGTESISKINIRQHRLWPQNSRACRKQGRVG